MPVPTSIPATLVAGDGWAWRDAFALAAFPAPDWALSYAFRPVSGGAGFNLSAIWGDGAYLVTALPVETAGRAAGEYAWIAVAENEVTGDRRTVHRGRVTILPDPMGPLGAELRSPAERILAAIDATLEGRATKDAESYSIEGRSISRTPVADLLRLRNLYAGILASETGAGNGFISYRRMRM